MGREGLLHELKLPLQHPLGRRIVQIRPALVCLHSGVFIRPQFCDYFETDRKQALRIVRALVARRAAIEGDSMMFPGGARLCRISNMAIYRALGVENIRHRRKARNSVLMRRLLSLDFVLKHPGMNWLPTEGEKVEFFEDFGISSRLLPRRIYYGDDGAKKRYFTLKLPIAGGAETVTFAYVDPGRESTGELNTWGSAHVPLWDAIRAKGRQVRVVAIAAGHEPIERADRVLRAWAAAPEKDGTGMSVKQEIAAIKDGMLRCDHEFLEQWGGWHPARERWFELEKLPEANLVEGVKIDEFSAYRGADPKDGGSTGYGRH